MTSRRRAGILCHPTSLPGPHGIGDLGEGAYRLVDFLVAAGQTLWQVLPLGPTGYGDSPYQPFSAFAGNPLLIDLRALVAEGLLDEGDLATAPSFPEERVLYGEVMAYKGERLRRSFERFQERASEALRAEFSSFCEAQRDWLEDYALFMALKLHFNWAVWSEWPEEIALRREAGLVRWREALATEVAYQRYLQFLFDRQWGRLKQYANAAGIQIIGDMPIFVGHDSADVWSHRELFRLDARGYPMVVAGVPPDYFSPTGQLWGNPLYRWGVMRANGYAWWLARLRRVLTQVDMVRLDHFRGFAGYWEVPAGEETAINGRWVRGPGEHFFRAVEAALGELPIIAEDLGLITPDVDALRESLGLPGMRVLQFAFDSDAASPHLPHNHTPDSVVYSGTHDNDTTVGWYSSLEEPIRHRVRLYTGSSGHDIYWTLIRLAMTSVAEMAIFPLQDVLGLGSEARLNLPGRPHGNWSWRFRRDALRPELAAALRELAILTGRFSEPQAQEEAASSEVAPLTYEEPEEG